MKNCGFDPKEYSCIYNLVKNEGSKMSKVFSENEMGDTILFDGTCSETYSMRANRETKQFRATISRLTRQSNETSLSSSEFIDRSEMHGEGAAPTCIQSEHGETAGEALSPASRRSG